MRFDIFVLKSEVQHLNGLFFFKVLNVNLFADDTC